MKKYIGFYVTEEEAQRIRAAAREDTGMNRGWWMREIVLNATVKVEEALARRQEPLPISNVSMDRDGTITVNVNDTKHKFTQHPDEPTGYCRCGAPENHSEHALPWSHPDANPMQDVRDTLKLAETGQLKYQPSPEAP